MLKRIGNPGLSGIKIVLIALAFMVIPFTVFALTGEGNSVSLTMDTVDPEVTVNCPNGGEEWYIGEFHDITWSATDYGLVANPIEISYSSNNGTHYDVLDSLEVNDGTYYWELPTTISYANLIKINAEDNFGNIGEDTSNGVFSITYVPPAPPEFVNVDVSNNIDAVITWAAVDTTIYGTPITPDGYIVLYNETAYEDSLHCYYFLAATDNATTTYTHLRVAEFRDLMFYQVVAYKDYRGNISKILAEITRQNNQMNYTLKNDNLKWSELKRRFR